MSTDLPNLPSDAQLLYEYLGQQVSSGEQRPAREVLDDLQAYSAQLERLRQMVREADESLAQGRAKELDLPALLERIRRRDTIEGSSN
jgi:hypothetical protein